MSNGKRKGLIILDRVLPSIPSRLLPHWCIEILSRLAAALVSHRSSRSRFAVESRIRGALSGGRFNSPSLIIGRRVEFDGNSIELGEGVRLYGDCYLNSNGPLGRISVGAETTIDRKTVLYGQGGIEIGCRCAIASGVIIYSQSNQYLASSAAVLDQPVTYDAVLIQDGVWIGAAATLLPGVTLGEGCVVGAGSVVKGKFEPGDVIAGVPAKVIRNRTSAQ